MYLFNRATVIYLGTTYIGKVQSLDLERKVQKLVQSCFCPISFGPALFSGNLILTWRCLKATMAFWHLGIGLMRCHWWNLFQRKESVSYTRNLVLGRQSQLYRYKKNCWRVEGLDFGEFLNPSLFGKSILSLVLWWNSFPQIYLAHTWGPGPRPSKVA